jgi:hypothetical protein
MRSRQRRLTKLLVAVLLAALLAACSPEAGRPRGGGPGASSANIPAGGVVPKSKVFAAESP